MIVAPTSMAVDRLVPNPKCGLEGGFLQETSGFAALTLGTQNSLPAGRSEPFLSLSRMCSHATWLRCFRGDMLKLVLMR